MAMNNNFDSLAEKFLSVFKPGDGEEAIEDQITAFLSDKGIDAAWLDEAFAFVLEYFDENYAE